MAVRDIIASNKETAGKPGRHPLTWIRQRLRTRADTEHEQALIRVIIGALVATHFGVGELLARRAGAVPGYGYLLGLLFLAIAIAYLIAVAAWPRVSPARRTVGATIDIGFISGALLHTGALGAPLYVLMLWIIFANGFRFGISYLLYSSLLSVAGFALALGFSDYWAAHRALGTGLLLGLVVLPAYMAFLIRRMEQARVNAVLANREKSRFLANMSHEFRTPLNAIIGYSEMLQEEARERSYDELLPDLGRIEAAGRHLTALINNVLDLSKIEAGKIEIHCEDVDINRLVQDVATSIRPAVEKGGNLLIVKVVPAHLMLRADPTKLRQIVLNLLGNAAKFTHNGAISLYVSTAGDDDTRELVIDVEDTGIGMDPEQLKQLFLDFSQVSRSARLNARGTGLGLAITRRLCHILGGDIQVDSAPGQGSRFRVQLPVAAPASPTGH
jgi:two-component system sensor histidine kinase RpfC